jgi:heme-degrading monooxygenase HmoA
MHQSKGTATISLEKPFFTLVNVFSVEPSNQNKVIQLLQNDIQEVIRNLPGFVSCSIHAGLDGNTVINYAQWKTKEYWEAMRNNPEATRRMGRVHKLATLDSHPCRVESVHHI